MLFVVRKMELEDADAVNHLSQQLGYSLAFQETFHQVEKILLRNDHVAFVATHNDKIIGWIHAFQALYLESLPFAEIGGLIIDNKHRGKGIGKALVKEVKVWCLRQNVYRVRVRTQTKRFDAQQFYSAFGFKEIKEQKVYQLELSGDEHSSKI